MLALYFDYCIVMSMNIYIKPEIEVRLRKESSMSGLINTLLAGYYKQIDQGFGTLAEFGTKVDAELVDPRDFTEGQGKQ